MAGLTPTTAQELAATYRLTEKQLSVVATDELFAHITKEMYSWREIAPHLGLSATDREDIAEKTGTPKEQRLYMLEKWKEKFGSEATFFKLVEALLNSERRNLAEQVCAFLADLIKRKEDNIAYYTALSSSLKEYQYPPQIPSDRQYAETALNREVSTTADESSPLLTDRRRHDPNQQPQHIRKGRYYEKLCVSVIAALLLCCILAGAAISMLILASTRYNKYHIPSPETVDVIEKDLVVLLGEYDPFYVGSVTCTSETATTFLYKQPCQKLTFEKRTVELHKDLNVTQEQNYPISEYYLVKGSQIDFKFQFALNHSYFDQDSLPILYVFDHFDDYKHFLQDKVVSGRPDKHYLQNESVSLYQLNADHTRYYFVGLQLPNASLIESVEFEITGSEFHYDLKQYEDEPDCILTELQNKRKECPINTTSNTSSNICILGQTPENASKVKCEAHGNIEVEKVWGLLTGFGYGGLGSALGGAAATFSCCYGAIAAKKYKRQRL